MRKFVGFERTQVLADGPAKERLLIEGASPVEAVELAHRCLWNAIVRLEQVYDADITEKSAILQGLSQTVPGVKEYIAVMQQAGKGKVVA